MDSQGSWSPLANGKNAMSGKTGISVHISALHHFPAGTLEDHLLSLNLRPLILKRNNNTAFLSWLTPTHSPSKLFLNLRGSIPKSIAKGSLLPPPGSPSTNHCHPVGNTSISLLPALLIPPHVLCKHSSQNNQCWVSKPVQILPEPSLQPSKGFPLS